MSLLFVLVKAWRAYESSHDLIIAMVLFDLDLLVLAEYLRIWMARRGR